MNKVERIQRLSQVFTPSAAVQRIDLFQGRIDQVMQVNVALGQPGRQVVLYGERGVGKTSLANLLTDLYAGPQGAPVTAIRVNCTTADSFSSVWRKVFRNAGIEIPDEWKYETPDPDEIRRLLGLQRPPVVIVLDEYDRIEDDDTLSLMADTLKALADHATETKVVIVGVATSIDALIGEHESVRRAIAEVLMPRMTSSELVRIVDRGFEQCEMTIQARARAGIVRLAEGLPHYVHLLSLSAGTRCAAEDRSEVSIDDVRAAIQASIGTHTLVKDFQTAVQSPRRVNLFTEVLVSCALAKKNRLGQFSAADVRLPMSDIMGTYYDIPAFAPHLKSFTEFERGSVLIREGSTRRYTYRFRDPLLQPFAVMTALSEGKLTPSQVEDLFKPLDADM